MKSFDEDIGAIETNPLVAEIGVVQYWDDDIENFLPGNLTLKNYGYIFTHSEGSIEANISPVSRYYVQESEQFGYLYVKIVDHNFSLVDAFLLNFQSNSVENNQLNKIKFFFEELNSNFYFRASVFQKEVSSFVQVANLNVDTNTIIKNFVELISDSFFLDIDYFKAIEKKLFNVNPKGLFCLLSNHLDTPIDETYKTVQSFFDEEFMMLSEIIGTKFDIPLNQSIFVTWELLKSGAIDYYYNHFNENYCDYMHDCIGVNQHVEAYFNIEVLNHESVNNAAMLTYYLLQKIPDHDMNFLELYQNVCEEIICVKNKRKINSFHNALLTNHNHKTTISIDDIDLMGGHEFEYFVSKLFSKMGYSTTVTKGSGDQGIDIIAERSTLKIGIQAKCYSNTVTNKAIQEVVAGIKHYNLNKGIVITNNFFTESAKELATSNEVILWDRNILKEKITDIFN